MSEEPAVIDFPVEFPNAGHPDVSIFEILGIIQSSDFHPYHSSRHIVLRIFHRSGRKHLIVINIVNGAPISVKRRCRIGEIVSSLVSDERPDSLLALILSVAENHHFSSAQLRTVRTIAVEILVDLLLHRPVRTASLADFLQIPAPIGFRIGLYDHRRLVNDVFAMPDLHRDGYTVIVIQPDA